MQPTKDLEQTHKHLLKAIQKESQKFQEFYLWLEKAMPPIFFEEVSTENIMLITHNLLGFPQQEFFSTIHLKRAGIVMLLDSADADLRVLRNYSMYGIKNYQTYVSKEPPPFPGVTKNLRIALLFFTEAVEKAEAPYPKEDLEKLRALVKKRDPDLSDQEFDDLMAGINSRFLRSMPMDRLILALDMFFRAKTRDNCQYEIRYNEDWETLDIASMQIVLAWRNTPKHHFLYRIARTVHHHGLVMKRVNASYINPYGRQNILLMSLSLHGSDGRACWDVANIPDFLRELATVKYFASFDEINNHLVEKDIISRNTANFLRAAVNFIHQILVNVDINLYTVERIENDLCRHPELTEQLCEAFKYKFDPNHQDLKKYEKVREKFIHEVNQLDTGHMENDVRRKNVLLQAMNFVDHILKTNAYRLNFTALSFRLDPAYLDHVPFDRSKIFPELPFAIFYMKGMHYFGFHIRFKDLSRGGLRTIYPEQTERMEIERNTVFAECYNLAYTQHKKNKDIPEGGAKGVIFLKPYDRLHSESLILEKELLDAGTDPEEVNLKIEQFRKDQKIEFLHQAQRSYIECLLTIINCEPDGRIRARRIVDYWKKPEYIYLGPDENMHDPMIRWIADFSRNYHYKPGGAFISGKPDLGINHKEYGVTSLGVNVYMEEVLKYLEIDPAKTPFTVKISGGPDGDVAGNQIKNLHRFYPKTAKLVALTDVSGTINDPKGLDLKTLVGLFEKGLSIKHYPPEKLHDEGFLVDREAKRSESAYVQQTLCWRKKNGEVVQDWLSGSDMNHLIRFNVHKTPTDVFIPAGGRPRTLNEHNVQEFLDETGKPTAKAIIEGANLYLTPEARSALEEKGVLIIKDSSANKTGVICSSFEILCGLTLSDEAFLENKPQLVEEILERLRQCARNEARLLLQTYDQTGEPLTVISDQISAHINKYTDQLLNYFEHQELPKSTNSSLIKIYLDYALPTLSENFHKELLEEVPDIHKKAIIASKIAAELVYKRGLTWSPSIVDVLPILLRGESFKD